jgi:NagD protein
MTPVPRQYAGYVFDCDGTVYLGEDALPGAVEAIATLRSSGARTLFLTNNPTELQAYYAERLTGMGIPTAPSDVVSSIDALLAYLGRLGPRPRLFAIAEAVLCGVLSDAGYDLVEDPAAAVDVVVVSFDRTFDYQKLKRAFDAVRAGARIVATNPDRFCPSPDGGLPDCAAMLAALEACTGVDVDAVVGKPSQHIGAVVAERLGVACSDVLVVGDRLETDMPMARRLSMDFALALTGATSAHEVPAGADAPDYVIETLMDLTPGPAA